MLRIKDRTSMIWLTIISVLILGLISAFTGPEHKAPSKRSDFPVLQPSSAYIILHDMPFEEQIDMSEIVVDATVNKVYPMETRKYIPEPGSAEARAYEEMGVKAAYYGALKVEMKAEEYVKGDAGETFMMSIVSVNLDSAPDFKVGDRFLLTLKRYIDGTYTNVSPVSSYFFIAHDEKAYPAGDDAPTQRFSGMDLNAVKQEIKEIA